MIFCFPVFCICQDNRFVTCVFCVNWKGFDEYNFCNCRAMSKRVAEEPPSGGSEPPQKKIVFEPLQLGR